jgi:putative aldouronate transport system permease protein
MTTSAISSMDKEPLGLTIKYATVIIATVPILTVYPFIQKYFIKGVMIGAIKG